MLCVSAVAVAACDGNSPDARAVVVNPDSASVHIGETQQFSAAVQQRAGVDVSAVPITWTATGGTVSADGKFTAGSVPGRFRVVAAAANASHDSAVATVIVLPQQDLYATTFPLTENPLSEGGLWMHHDPLLTPVQTRDGRAFGTQTGVDGYDDSNAYITGFGSDYEVDAIVWKDLNYKAVGNREVELLLRWSDDGPLRASSEFGPTHAVGYEINAQFDGGYMQLWRFKGELLTEVGSFGQTKPGDRFRARIEGQHIRVWWNETLIIDYTDSDPTLAITQGNPGIGFYVSGGASNRDFGFESVIVRALPASANRTDYSANRMR